MSIQSASSRATKYILFTAIILLVEDMIFIIVIARADLPSSALLIPLCLTAVSALLLAYLYSLHS